MGLGLLWAHNLFVVGLKISYYGSFSAETQSNAQFDVHSFTLFSPKNPLSSPIFLLFIAKVSGKIMITATVCAIEGPISFDLSGCLGERAVLHL